MSWAAIGASVAGAVVAGGLSAASASAMQPHAPNAATSGRKGVLADLRTLPGRRALENAARLGIAVDYPTGRRTPIYGPAPVYRDGRGIVQHGTPQIVGYTPEVRHVDFSGMGDADVQATVARITAEHGLETQQRYGEDFARTARQQADLADPLGSAARVRLHEELMQREQGREDKPHPVADELNTQIEQDLQRGRAISPEAQKLIAEMTARRGGAAGGVTANIEGDLSTNAGAEQRLQQRDQHGLSFLSSGATPEDVDYRRRQQSLADMSSFLAGRGPTAQFQSLSSAGARGGATPQFRGPALPGPNPNAAALGQQGALTNYGQQVQQVTGNVNNWFAGLTTALRGAGAVVAANQA